MKKFFKVLWMTKLAIITMLPMSLLSQSNQYLHFDMVDDYTILEGAGQYVDGASALSITGWFYCDQLSYGQGYMGFRVGSGNGEFYLIQLNNGVMECRFKSTTGLHEYVSPPNTAIPQIWQHFAWVYDGSSLLLYVNGALNGSSSASGVFSNADAPFGIGKSLLGGFNFVYGGRIDEVTVWDKALSATDIQDMMDNELTGNEPNLQLYYKFNQGEPGGDNTSITHLISETGSGERDSELMNFALTGATSNFNGTLDPGYQAISFPQIPNHLTTDPPFQLEATATSGLEVIFEVISGPATIDGNTLTLTGSPGEVIVEASQPGNGTYDPADPVQNTFFVIDPAQNVPNIDARNPLAGDVYVPELGYIQLAALIDIDYPELFSVTNVRFHVNGQTLDPTDWGDGYYSGWWPVPSYGNHDITIVATNNFGYTSSEVVNINIVSDVSDMEVLAVDDVWLKPDNPSQVVDAELPSYMGAFNQITATLEVNCPPGGCGEWDRVASIDAKGHDGKWVEIIRYVTPYGVACSHTIDLTDYMSVLQGKVSFRLNCSTLDNGFLYDLKFNFNEGTPQYNYSLIDIVWWETYPFGDYSNLQPVENVVHTFAENALAAKLKLVSTGHGWGTLNTGNAAEFYNATHHVWINGEEKFEQHNWMDCNPNPDACQPQNGTWYHDRAGWCPGSIAPWFDYELTEYVSDGSLEMGYVFYEDYVDLCHPNHPDCITGVTCSNCDDGFNPHLIVACNLVSFSDMPLDGGEIVSVDKNYYDLGSYISLFPNPSNGIVELQFHGKASFDKASVSITSVSGSTMHKFDWYGENTSLDLTGLSKGLFFVNIKINDFTEVKKLVIQ